MADLAHYERLREQLVDGKVVALLREEFDPFSKANFEEFVENMSITVLEVLRQGASASQICTTGAALRNGAITYWTKAARERAEKDIPSAEQMKFENWR